VFNFVTVLSLLLCVAMVTLWVRRNMDRMVPLAPGVWLSRDGGSWSILDNTNTPKGLEQPPGGIVVVEDVAALEAVDGRYIIGRSRGGAFFILSVRQQGHDEPADSAIERFSSEAEWRAALRSRNIDTSGLKDPKSY
jgi:hypothetical protein